VRKLLGPFLALLLILFPLNCFAFGQAGHRIICEVAYQMLDNDIRSQVDRLLKTMPDDHREALNKSQGYASDAEVTFSSACVWPDVVKRGDEYNGTAEWHYINVQRADIEVELDDCMVGCLLSAIEHHRAVFESDSNPWARAQALMFLGHWLADIHQPMHVSFGDDRGGNGVKVSVADKSSETGKSNGVCSNLHLLWDVCIIENTGLDETELTATLKNEINQLQREIWSSDPVIEWANESLAIGRSKSVLYCREDGSVCEKIPTDADQPVRQLPDDYLQVHWPILKERMQRASVRLVWLLNEMFD